jgi:heme exporter protein D
LAGGVVVLPIAIVVVGGVLAARVCLRVMRRCRERRMWDDLVARHLELDRELDKIWRGW